MSFTLLSVSLRQEHDLVFARQRARQLAGLLGFDDQDQIRVATAVSEIARNALRYAGGGKVTFEIQGRSAPQLLRVEVTDQGPGVRDLDAVLEGRYRSATGMGMGIVGSRRLMDRFEIESWPGNGTRVLMAKLLPRGSAVIGPKQADELGRRLQEVPPHDVVGEIQRQNQELLRALEEVRLRQIELERLNRELEDTNRGVVALYAELDEKADHLRRADDMKTRFLSNMSHEFRTPLNSILALSRLLLDGTDGPLTEEQERQVTYVRKAAEDLKELVDDLLDLAKVEAGKIVVRPTEFDAGKLFGALRGMLRPLLVSDRVALVFDDPDGCPTLHTDEGKVSQILRNFISNGLKFTEQGEVRIAARCDEDGNVVFSVTDTGIGIAPEDMTRIFEEFGQVENPLQRRFHGTGLGLPLSKRLAELLGGRLEVESTPGRGSTFRAIVPAEFRAPVAPEPSPSAAEGTWHADDAGIPVLAIEDSPAEILAYQRMLEGTPYRLAAARSLREARRLLDARRPAAVILDIMLKGEDSWGFLVELKAGDDPLPVLVVSTVDDRAKGMALGADDYGLKPVEASWLIQRLDALTTGNRNEVLVIDDEPATRYVLRRCLTQADCRVVEADNGADGLRLANQRRPAGIVLDLKMPGMSGLDVLDRLRESPVIGHIPVVIATSKHLDRNERTRLEAHGVTVFPKGRLAESDAGERLRDALILAGAPPAR